LVIGCMPPKNLWLIAVFASILGVGFPAGGGARLCVVCNVARVMSFLTFLPLIFPPNQ
jgi:hypothetical protein